MSEDTRSQFTNNILFTSKLDKYGKLWKCTRRQLMDYCLKMQDIMFEVNSSLIEKGVIVTFDCNDKVHVKIHKESK